MSLPAALPDGRGVGIDVESPLRLQRFDVGTLQFRQAVVRAENWLVDRCVKRPRLDWNVTHRFMHGLGFEAGIVVLCLPVAAWMLDISLLKAFMAGIGFFIFILPYTIAYNWAFDKAKAKFSRAARTSQA